MKRTIDSIQPDEVVHCKTPEEAEKFCKMLDDSSRCLWGKITYTGIRLAHIEELGFIVQLGTYGSIASYESDNRKIIPATEFIEDEDEQERGELLIKQSVPVQVKYVPYQLCPMCNGVGEIPIGIYGTTNHCRICDRKGIIPQYVIE